MPAPLVVATVLNSQLPKMNKEGLMWLLFMLKGEDTVIDGSNVKREIVAEILRKLFKGLLGTAELTQFLPEVRLRRRSFRPAVDARGAGRQRGAR